MPSPAMASPPPSTRRGFVRSDRRPATYMQAAETIWNSATAMPSSLRPQPNSSTTDFSVSPMAKRAPPPMNSTPKAAASTIVALVTTGRAVTGIRPPDRQGDRTSGSDPGRAIDPRGRAANDAGLLQLLDDGGSVPELSQDGLGVLAQQRGGARRDRPRAVQPHGRGDHGRAAREGMRRLHEHGVGGELGVGEDLLALEDRRARDVVLGEHADPFVPVAAGERALEDRRQTRARARPVERARVRGIRREIGAAERPTEPAPLLVLDDHEHQVVPVTAPVRREQ